jgi:predicted ATP-dependent protease
VRADFDTELDRTTEHVQQYAAFISQRVHERSLAHFHREAVAKIAAYGARLLEHQERLSARLDQIAGLVDEAAHWAARDSCELVMAEHIQRAIDEKTYRSNLVEEKIQRLIDEETIFIDTDGVRVGQVNGLSTHSLGD